MIFSNGTGLVWEKAANISTIAHARALTRTDLLAVRQYDLVIGAGYNLPLVGLRRVRHYKVIGRVRVPFAFLRIAFW